MPNEYISREAAQYKIREQNIYPETPFGQGLSASIDILQGLPAADVAPVVHGEWIEFDGEGTYQCTYCGEPFMLMEGTPRDNEYNYCPKCGAYLREGLDGGEPHD